MRRSRVRVFVAARANRWRLACGTSAMRAVTAAPTFWFFFFSSRRRHTRWPRDWSSDVCSSDLEEVVAACSEADLTIVNLECCISTRGTPWPDPKKPFFFRAPPVATEALDLLGVDCVSLANNHALDFGTEALLDTFEHLDAADIKWVGAGTDVERARRPVLLEAAGVRLGVRAVTDHPAEFAAGPAHPGVAFANLREATPEWLCEAVPDADATLVSAHWGPNMITTPMPHVRRAARDLRRCGMALLAGHSAHVFHGVEDRILYDLGDFIDDYAIDPELRNNLGLLFLITFEPQPRRLEAIPLALDYGHT